MVRMEIAVEKNGDVVIVSPTGDLDAESAPLMRSRCEELLGDGENKYVIDLSNVAFMDSSGISALVNLYKRVRIGEGDVKLCNMNEEIAKIFNLTKLNRVFDIYGDSAEAVSSF